LGVTARLSPHSIWFVIYRLSPHSIWFVISRTPKMLTKRRAVDFCHVATAICPLISAA